MRIATFHQPERIVQVDLDNITPAVVDSLKQFWPDVTVGKILAAYSDSLESKLKAIEDRLNSAGIP